MLAKISKQTLYLYGLFVVWGLVAFLWRYMFSPSAFSLSLIVLWFIFIPGYFLSRIIKIELKDWLDRLIISLISGLIFDFVIFFIVELFGFNIFGLSISYFIALTILVTISIIMVSEVKREPIKIVWRDLFGVHNWLNILAIILILGTFAILSQVGGNFEGDPFFHISMMRKIVDGHQIAYQNLNYVKYVVDELYAFPVWHMLLGLSGYISGLSIFSVWQESPVVLSALVLIVWYWILKQILPTKYLAILAFNLFILFMITRFSLGGKVYLFRQLGIPDTICQMMFLPLAIGLSLRYIFDKTLKAKWLILTLILILFAGIIHLIQYVYLVGVIGVFGLFYLCLGWGEPDFKDKLRKIGLLLGGFVAVILPYFVLLQSVGKVVSSTAVSLMGYHNTEVLKYGSFPLFRVITKIGYILAPFLLILSSKYKKLWLVPLMFGLVFLVYSTGLKTFLIKLVSFSTVQRLYSDMEWTFVVWAVVIGFAILILAKLTAKLAKGVQITINGILVLFSFYLIFLASRAQIYPWFRDGIGSITKWLDPRYVWLIIIGLIISIFLLIVQQKSEKTRQFFLLEEPKNYLTVFLFTIIAIIVISSPSHYILTSKVKAEAADRHFFGKVNDPVNRILDYKDYGGEETINFIRDKIPPKMVFDTNKGFDNLPLLVDQFMSNYWSLASLEFSKIYDDRFSINEKLGCINLGKIDYLLVFTAVDQPLSFDSYPQYFTRIFKNERTRIYQINHQTVDQFPAPVANWDAHICRSKKPR